MLCKHEVVGSIPSSSTIQVTEVGEQATVEPSLASLSVARQRSMVCSREESAVLRAVSFFNNLEGKGVSSLMRARYAIGLSCIFTRLGALETKGWCIEHGATQRNGVFCGNGDGVTAVDTDLCYLLPVT